MTAYTKRGSSSYRGARVCTIARIRDGTRDSQTASGQDAEPADAVLANKGGPNSRKATRKTLSGPAGILDRGCVTVHAATHRFSLEAMGARRNTRRPPDLKRSSLLPTANRRCSPFQSPQREGPPGRGRRSLMVGNWMLSMNTIRLQQSAFMSNSSSSPSTSQMPLTPESQAEVATRFGAIRARRPRQRQFR